VLRLLAGWRRTRATGWAATVWAGTWLLVLVGAWVGGSAGWFVAAAIAFAVGETLLTPSLPAIVNDLAPEELRGCYNGGLTLAYTTGFVAGPLLCGLVLDGAGGPGPLCIALIVGCGGCAALGARLGRRLPSTVNLVPEPTQAHVPARALTAATS
jgi:MFS family permease